MHNAVCVPLGLVYNFEENVLYFSRKVHTKHIQIRNKIISSHISLYGLCGEFNRITKKAARSNK